jgi:hypothetical protein
VYVLCVESENSHVGFARRCAKHDRRLAVRGDIEARAAIVTYVLPVVGLHVFQPLEGPGGKRRVNPLAAEALPGANRLVALRRIGRDSRYADVARKKGLIEV